MTVIVTWLDGLQETYSCYEYRTGTDGVLWITQRMHSGQPKRGIPLAGVRIFTVEGE